MLRFWSARWKKEFNPLKKGESLRILAVSYDYRPRLGGVSTFAYELLRALSARRDLNIRMVAPQMDGCDSFDKKLDIETIRIPLPTQAMKAMPSLGVEIGKQLLEWKPHAVINFLWMPDGASTYLAAPVRSWKKIPYFLFAHGVEMIESDRNLRKKIRAWSSPFKRKVFKNASHIFCNSHFTSGLVEKNCGIPKDDLSVVYCGVDPVDYFPAPKSEDLIEKFGLEGKKVFLTLSRLLDYKGMDRAIAALRRVVSTHPDVVYLICGEGEDRSRLEALVRHYRVQKHVKFTGPVPWDRVNDYYNLCDAFVLLSREDWVGPNVEGFGIVFIEAAACGKPSIGGRSGGISDAVQDGVTGWLVDPTDDSKIAQAMLEVIEHPRECLKRGETAKQRAIHELTWSHMAARVIKRIRKEVDDHVRD